MQTEEKKYKLLDELYALHRFGIKPGLERTEALLANLKNPELNYPIIHVAGTNGKGSICSMLASILKEAGYKVGLYTSPHIIDFNERIRINGITINDEDLINITQDVLNIGKNLEATFFEITTAIAFKYFSLQKVDIAIIETGMGGLYDSTNVVKPILSIITDIDYDHKEYLGNTLEEIAFQKAGIIKYDTPCIVQEYRTELFPTWEKVAYSKSSEIIYSQAKSRAELVEITSNFAMKCHIITENDYYNNIELPLAGIHQLKNLQTFIIALEQLNNKFTINKNNIYLGLKNLKANSGHSARIGIYSSNPLLIYDVSHNEASIESFVNTYKQSPFNDKLNIVFTAMNDKNIYNMLLLLKPITNTLILTTPNIERVAKIEDLHNSAKELKFAEVITTNSVDEAISIALGKNNSTAILGSFYLIGEALKQLTNQLKP